jgi:hypothetical protein
LGRREEETKRSPAKTNDSQVWNNNQEVKRKNRSRKNAKRIAGNTISAHNLIIPAIHNLTPPLFPFTLLRPALH